MQCLIYESDVDELDRAVQLYHTYVVGHAKIRKIPENSPILGDSKYEIILNRSSFIKPPSKDQEFSLQHVYELTPFAQCPGFADVVHKLINLLCAVVHVFPPRTTQANKWLQEFVIVNQECRPMILTLMGRFHAT